MIAFLLGFVVGFLACPFVVAALLVWVHRPGPTPDGELRLWATDIEDVNRDR